MHKVSNVQEWWRFLGGLLIVLMLILFAGIGVAQVINPDRFIKHTGVRKGGEMLGKWNRDSFRVVGVILRQSRYTCCTSYFARISATLKLFDLRSSA